MTRLPPFKADILEEFKQSSHFHMHIKELENQPDNLKRYEVLERANMTEVPMKEKAKAIFEWGGMRRNYQEMVLGSENTEWLGLCEEILSGKCTRAQAYDVFSELQAAAKVKGMGPAYFTKLIYFLMPENGGHPCGYIMDQWAGCSVNLLFGDNIVLMDTTMNWKSPSVQSTSFIVSNANNGKTYEAFCSAMDALGKKCDLNRHQVDIAVMSKGGKEPLPWRRYVKSNRKPHVCERSG